MIHDGSILCIVLKVLEKTRFLQNVAYRPRCAESCEVETGSGRERRTTRVIV